MQETNTLSRGGRPGAIYATTEVLLNAAEAQKKLALPQKSMIRVRFRDKQGEFGGPTTVKADNFQPGGGWEVTAISTRIVPIEILFVERCVK